MLQPLKGFFPASDYPQLRVGLDSPDDAAVWALNDEQQLVVTTDFFTPVVDDPADFGAIAAANAVSDVYAMGGLPFLALNLACLPGDLPVEISQAIFKGGAEKIKEAGAVLAGGHSVQDKDPKFGYAVIGMAKKSELMRKDAAQAGDKIYLTKPLGIGVATTALKQGKANREEIVEVTQWMKRLNRPARDLAIQIGAKACTDVTGFGLLGHLIEVAEASNLGFSVNFEQIPFMSSTQKFASMFTFSGGAHNNHFYFSKNVALSTNLTEIQMMLINDPQTSGGLLIFVDPDKEPEFLKRAPNLGVSPVLIGEMQHEKQFLLR